MVLLLTPASHGAETTTHSGVVLAVDRVAGTIILGEVNELQTQRGVEIIRRPIVIEVATDAWRLQEGDFVMVECVHDGSRRVATKITLVDGECP